MYIYTHTYTYVCVYMFMFIYIYIYQYILISRTHAHTHTHTLTLTHTLTHVHTPTLTTRTHAHVNSWTCNHAAQALTHQGCPLAPVINQQSQTAFVPALHLDGKMKPFGTPVHSSMQVRPKVQEICLGHGRGDDGPSKLLCRSNRQLHHWKGMACARERMHMWGHVGRPEGRCQGDVGIGHNDAKGEQAHRSITLVGKFFRRAGPTVVQLFLKRVLAHTEGKCNQRSFIAVIRPSRQTCGSRLSMVHLWDSSQRTHRSVSIVHIQPRR